MSEKQWFEVFSPKSCEVMAVPTILKMAITSDKLNSDCYSIEPWTLKWSKQIHIWMYVFILFHV